MEKMQTAAEKQRRRQMKPGNITQTAWNRSVKKQLHTEMRYSVFRPSPEENCSGLRVASEDSVVWSSASVTGDSPRTVWYAALQAAGNLAARGVMPQGVSLRILFPEETEEEMLAAAAGEAQEVCSRMGTELTCLQGEVNPAVRQMIVVADAAGAADSRGFTGIMSPGQEILLCGYTGLEGMLHILDEAEEELAERFVPSFLGQAGALQSDLVMPEQILAGCRTEASGGGRLISAARQIGSGGILAALWEMAEISGTGLEVSMEAMALKQETVEICEHFQINPYQMTSAGSYLIATEHAEELMGVLEKAGARAGRLGIAKAQNARVITSGDETRYLDRPAPDSLMCWQRERLFENRAREYIS